MRPARGGTRVCSTPSGPLVGGLRSREDTDQGIWVTGASGGKDGGDEETRTPDPLLAKEMLYQLSYVPQAPQEEWWAFLDSNQRPLPYQGSALTS